MDRAATLEQLARLCRTGRDSVRAPAIEASGSTALDAALPGGGWQVGSMVELMPEAVGIGELRLVMPTLARITHSERYIALISPPYIPFPAALSQHGVQLERMVVIRAENPADALWACEQTLRCKSFGAVLAWPTTIKDREIRRLQLAAEAGQSIGFLYRSPGAALEASPAATRLRLQSNQEGSMRVEVLKCRGGRGGFAVNCDAKAFPGVTHAATAAAVN
jgi:cell division inhibitor SulA/protein ImuA